MTLRTEVLALQYPLFAAAYERVLAAARTENLFLMAQAEEELFEAVRHPQRHLRLVEDEDDAGLP